MNWLRKFMIGRYGVDELSITILIITFILAIITPILKLPSIIYIVMSVLVYIRVFSRNVNKRYMENQKFLNSVKPITTRFNRTKRKVKGRKKYKYFKCKNCKQVIEVPKGKGKIRITCSKCGEKFIKET